MNLLQPLRAFRATVLAVVGCACLQAHANPKEALLAFDGLCVATRGDPSVIERIARAKGAKPVPDSVLATDPAVARFGGKGFGFVEGANRFVLIVTSVHSCSILWMSEYKPEVAALLESNYPLAKPWIEESGAQITNLYRVLNSSVHSGSYLSITRPKPAFADKQFFSIGFIPEEVAVKMGIRK